MSKDFAIKPIDLNDVKRIRSQGASLDGAQRQLRFENLETGIHHAKDLEDVKVCMLAMLYALKRA